MEIFPKVLVQGFYKKNRIFYQGCFLGKSSQKRSFFDIVDKKRMIFRVKK